MPLNVCVASVNRENSRRPSRSDGGAGDREASGTADPGIEGDVAGTVVPVPAQAARAIAIDPAVSTRTGRPRDNACLLIRVPISGFSHAVASWRAAEHYSAAPGGSIACAQLDADSPA